MLDSLLPFFRNWMLPIQKIDAKLPDQGIVYEIGSGYGSLAHSLCVKSDRKVIGIDRDNNKINVAASSYNHTNLQFIKADAVKMTYQVFSGAVMSDFLHHVEYSIQETILEKLQRKISKQGVLIIKEIDANDGIRKWLSRLWDLILYPNDKIYYRSLDDWKSLLNKQGFEVNVSREVAWFPGSTFLFICSKKSKK